MNRKFLLLLLVIGCVREGFCQDIPEFYIDSALKNNLVLQQKNISLTDAVYALEIAKGMFYPSVELQGAYQTAGGGRDIPLPLGDLLNGVYVSLNQLTQTQQFPQLKNEKVNFLPSNFYDLKVRTTLPIYNAQLHYNKKLREQQIQLNTYDIEIYKRQLIKDVKTAYYNYLESLEAIDIYTSSLQLAQEGKRVNERLLENGKGLPAYVLRASSEIESVNSKIIEAQQNADNAKRYFNFLLNRDQQSEIVISDTHAEIERRILSLLSEEAITTGREELEALNEVIDIQENVLKMNKSATHPSLSSFLDLGSQAQNWKFDDQSRYYMIGLQMTVPLFTGQQNRYKIRQASLGMENAMLNKAYQTEQIELSSQVAKNKLLSAYHSYLSAKKQLESAVSYQRLIDRGYREGVNTYIETIDARNQLTQAQLSVNLNRYKILIAAAALERETASFPLP